MIGPSEKVTLDRDARPHEHDPQHMRNADQCGRTVRSGGDTAPENGSNRAWPSRQSSAAGVATQTDWLDGYDSHDCDRKMEYAQWRYALHAAWCC